jgi:hypothetical protein
MEVATMKKTYFKPESELILIQPVQLLAGSGPAAGDMPNPGIGSRELFDFDIMGDEQLNEILKEY